MHVFFVCLDEMFSLSIFFNVDHKLSRLFQNNWKWTFVLYQNRTFNSIEHFTIILTLSLKFYLLDFPLEFPSTIQKFIYFCFQNLKRNNQHFSYEIRFFHRTQFLQIKYFLWKNVYAKIKWWWKISQISLHISERLTSRRKISNIHETVMWWWENITDLFMKCHTWKMC
jgi:hypothetical protein